MAILNTNVQKKPMWTCGKDAFEKREFYQIVVKFLYKFTHVSYSSQKNKLITMNSYLQARKLKQIKIAKSYVQNFDVEKISNLIRLLFIKWLFNNNSNDMASITCILESK